MPVFQDKFFLWGISLFLGSLVAHSLSSHRESIFIGLTLCAASILFVLAFKDSVPLRSMILISVSLFLAGLVRTMLWDTRSVNVIERMNHVDHLEPHDFIEGYGQVQGMKWGGVNVFCVGGDPGLRGKSLILFGISKSESRWLKFRLRAPHALAKRGFYAFYANAEKAESTGFFGVVLDMRILMRERMIAGLNEVTGSFQALNSFWSSAIMRHDGYYQSSLKNELKQLGLGAIFAVSGLHINLLSLMLIAVLALLPLKSKTRFILFGLVIFIYSMLVGFTASVLRSMTFAFLMELGSNTHLIKRNIRILSLVFILHILLFPSEVLEPGFLLSYGLTFMLIFLSESYPTDGIKSLILQGISIQLLLFPYFLWQFGEYPLMHFSSVFLAPIFSIILAVGFWSICLAQVSTDAVVFLVSCLAPLMESFIVWCSEWGRSSTWYFHPTESFAGNWVVGFYGMILFWAIGKPRHKVSVVRARVRDWENFLSENKNKPYEVYEAIFERIFEKPYKPIASLKLLQGECENWNLLAYEHFIQEWVSCCYINLIDPIRRQLNCNQQIRIPDLTPLRRHFIEGKLSLHRSERSLYELSSWLKSDEFNSSSTNKLLDWQKQRLSNILNQDFPLCYAMRFLKSPMGSVLNNLPVMFKSILINYISFKLRSCVT